ncbi:ImuA family protein [Henriciella aquimarina]|uniref:ImuA family protein n=1 Tax=Henriciella aquimarina TaxID=545261 RepID=UPI0009FF5F0D|nr:hypothetical protein [Henriciella aquimarina]
MSAKPDIRRLQALTAATLHGPAAHGDVRLSGPVRLARGRVHEVMGDGGEVFALAAAARYDGPLIWIGQAGDVASLAPSALQRFIDPARMILTIGQGRSELLWAAEQALRARSGPCVILELHDGPGLKESRRLQIAAEESGALGLVILHGKARTSAAETRWQCEAAAGTGWVWKCLKAKRGAPGAWQVSWIGGEHAPDLVAMAAAASA